MLFHGAEKTTLSATVAVVLGSTSFTPVEKTPICLLNGIHIGATQVASGSHAGPVDGSCLLRLIGIARRKIVA